MASALASYRALSTEGFHCEYCGEYGISATVLRSESWKPSGPRNAEGASPARKLAECQARRSASLLLCTSALEAPYMPAALPAISSRHASVVVLSVSTARL